MTELEASAIFAFASQLVKDAPSIALAVRDIYRAWQEQHPILRSLPPAEDESVAIQLEAQDQINEKFGLK